MEEKNFDAWNQIKKSIHARNSYAYAHPREVWWCCLGLNVGVEIDGKNENFERPVIIMKAYNKEMLLVLPLTSREKHDKFHHKIETDQKISWVKLTQPRMISSKRLLRKVDILGEEEFQCLMKVWKGTV